MYGTGMNGNKWLISIERPEVPPTAKEFGTKKKCNPTATRITPMFTNKNLLILKLDFKSNHLTSIIAN